MSDTLKLRCIVLLIVLAGGCVATAYAKTTLTKKGLPTNLPPCSKAVWKEMHHLAGHNGYQDEIVVCLRTRKGKYAWHRVLTSEVR